MADYAGLPTDGQDPDRKRKRRLLLIVKVLVSSGLIVWIVSKVNTGDIFATLRTADLRMMGVALCLQVVGSFLTASRWRLLLAAQGVQASLRFLFGSWMVGCFFKQFLPSTIGSDAIRVYDSYRAGASKAMSLAVIAVDRLVGSLILVLFAVLALALVPTDLVLRIPMLYLWVGLVTFALVFATWFIFMPTEANISFALRVVALSPGRLRRPLEKITNAAMAFRGHQKALGKALGLSVLLQLNVVIFYFLLSKAIGFDIAFVDFFFIVPVASFILLVPISINGIGLRESVFVFLLADYGVDGAGAVAYAWLAFGQFLAYGLLGGLVYVARKNTELPARPESGSR